MRCHRMQDFSGRLSLSSPVYSAVSRRESLARSFCSSPSLLSFSPLSPPLCRPSLFLSPSKPFRALRRPVKAVADGETSASDAEQAEAAIPAEEATTVIIPVSPSDMLTMFFQAEGTMDESLIPAVTKALQESEGTSNLSVRVAEGLATVELTKQTTVQATGVASNLVEIIQGAGFKLQALNLSFEDGEDSLN